MKKLINGILLFLCISVPSIPPLCMTNTNLFKVATILNNNSGEFNFPELKALKKKLCLFHNYEFHEEVKQDMLKDWGHELLKKSISNPDIGWEKKTGILVFRDSRVKTRILKTDIEISQYDKC